MRPRVYLETTIPSYLTAHRSADTIVAARQELTIDWWSKHRHRYELFVSVLVLDEARRGDEAAARSRLDQLRDIPVLEIRTEATDLAVAFTRRAILPMQAEADALHVGIATAEGMDYLVTWNCRHIANAEISRRLCKLCQDLGYEMPTLCTPEQLMGD